MLSNSRVSREQTGTIRGQWHAAPVLDIARQNLSACSNIHRIRESTHETGRPRADVCIRVRGTVAKGNTEDDNA